MKTIKAICAVTIFSLALCIPALAGDMSMPTVVAPPPPPPDTSAGNNSSPAVAGLSADILLDVILGVISLP